MKRLWVLLLVFLLLLTGCAKMDFGEATPAVDEKPSPQEEQEKVDTQKTDQPAEDPLLNTEPEKIEKDKNLTYAQRLEFFNLAQEYRFDKIPGSWSGKLPYVSHMADYVAVLDYGALEEVEPGRFLVPGEWTAKMAKERFGLDDPQYLEDHICYKDNDTVVMAELISYKEEQVDGKTVVTAKFFKHIFNELYYVDDPEKQGFSYFPGMKDYDENSIKAYELAQKEGSDFYSAAKKMVLNGLLTDADNGHSFEVTYETADGKTPVRIYIEDYGEYIY